MAEFALALAFRNEIEDAAVIEELDRAYARLNGFLRGLGQVDAEGALEDGEDPGSGVQISTFADLSGPFILPTRAYSLSSDVLELDPGEATILRVTPVDAARTISGIKGGRDGRIIIIQVPRSATQTLTLAHAASGAQANRRLDLVGAANLASVAGEARAWMFWFDAVDNVWQMYGGSAAIGAVGALDVNTAEVSVTNTTSQTSVYSFSLPANTLASGKILRLFLHGSYVKSAGATATFSMTVKLGSTTLASGTLASGLGSTANKRPTLLLVEIAGTGSNTQQATCKVWFGNAVADGTWTNITGNSIARDDPTEDETTVLTLDVLVTHNVADAGITFTRHGAVVLVN